MACYMYIYIFIFQHIKDYIAGFSDVPYVVHGSSGSGKTSLMAMAASQSREWTNQDGTVVILR